MSQRYLGGIITANPTLPTLSSASGVWTLEQDFQNSASITPQVIGRSVRLRSSATAYFNRTPASAGNQRTWTWSGWVKRGVLGSEQVLFSAGLVSPNIRCEVYFTSGDSLSLYTNGGTGSVDGDVAKQITTSAVYRDPSAWYHIVAVIDTTQATAANRLALYVNGVQVTSFSSTAYPSQNIATAANSTNVHYLARWVGPTIYYYDGYMTEVNFVDGQALTPSSFGAFDSNGIWQPLSYRGTYGTNGFYLNFSDNSAATATTIGKDYSGNGNNWTPNNISVTAGVTYDSMIDSPTNSVSASNYCVLNPLDWQTASFPITNGNLTWTSTTTAIGSSRGTTGMTTGKWYWEVLATSVGAGSCGVGVAKDNSANFGSGQALYTSNTGNKYIDGTTTAYGATWATNNVIGVAYDADAGQITFYKDNTSQGAITLSGYAGVNVCPVVSDASSLAFTLNANFGQRPFTYTPPTGFLALNTQNLPAVTINNGAQYMAAPTYTGTGSYPRSVTGLAFQPDFIWSKDRTTANNHMLVDSVRGGDKYLISNLTNAEATVSGIVSSFNADGYTFNAASGSTNANGDAYVNWVWKAGGTAVSNTSGSITSSVSANPTAGFSVVTYTGTGAVATFGHGLGVAPSMVIVKSRSSAVSWIVQHASLGPTQYLLLDSTAAAATSSSPWNNTAPTSSVVSIGASANVNTNAATYVAYCFAAVKGYSAFGSYTGNGSADGPFVYLGFRPRFVMIKETTAASTSDWVMHDTSRAQYNADDLRLLANSSGAQLNTGFPIDELSNGFKIRNTGNGVNRSAGTYIYMAFAENPFNISRAR